MRTCDDCNVEVTFLLLRVSEKGNNVWSPLAERLERVVTELEPGIWHVEERFELHECEEGTERRAALREEKKVAVQAKMTDYAKTETIDEMWERCLKRDCIKCFVKAGVRCVNLRNPKKKTYRPHPERSAPQGDK